jgi:hypothetical protein
LINQKPLKHGGKEEAEEKHNQKPTAEARKHEDAEETNQATIHPSCESGLDGDFKNVKG